MPNPPTLLGLRRTRMALGLLGVAMLLLSQTGCTRTDFRRRADRQVYGIEQSRMIDWKWELPLRVVEADPRSRMGDTTNPDRYPIPLDDPSARLYQVTNGLPWEFVGWKKRGYTPVENVDWQKYVPTGSDGAVLLTPSSSMYIFSLNSRDYQLQVENVYLAALNLTLIQFNYQLQPFAGQTTTYSHFGSGKNATNQLQLSTSPPGEGANLALMTGAQILTNLANSIVFQWTGKGPIQIITSGLVINATQPLAQNAFARIVTQPLSIQERNVLYAIRNFANLRRQYYVEVEGTAGFLGLLTQLQALRNQEAVLKQYQRSLIEYTDLVKAGFVNSLQKDNIDQLYQQSQLSLVGQQATLQTSLDAYKVFLGIPPNTRVRLDDSLLKLFELSDPRFDDLRDRNDKLYLKLLQYEKAPPKEVIAETTRKLLSDFNELQQIGASVSGELQKWRDMIPDEPPPGAAGTGNLLLDVVGAEGTTGDVAQSAGEISQNEVRRSIARQRDLSTKITTDLEGPTGTRKQITEYMKDARDLLQSLDNVDPDKALDLLRTLVGQRYRGQLADLYVAQTQIRVFLIELPEIELTLEQALRIGVENRLDLKNNLARVTDTWRNVEFAANQLRGVLNLNYFANLNKVPSHGALIGLDEAASSNAVSIQFQAPLVRRAQRNAYRGAQILYQQQRRAYMLNYDTILQQIRVDMRNLALARRQFEIGREQLIIATRQVDQNEYNLRNSSGADSGVGQSAALNLQTALNALLGAKNTLITTWANYMTQRMTLFWHFDLMNIDAQGVWTNEHDDPLAIANLPGGSATVTATQPVPPPPANSGPFAPR